MHGMQIFQLYGNLLTDEDCQPWDKIVKVKTNTIPWEDLRGEVHEKKAGKTWTSFLDCVFGPNAATAVKFYIRNTLKNPNRQVKQLNSYLESLLIVLEIKDKLGNKIGYTTQGC